MTCNMTEGKFLGYFFGLGSFLSRYPHGSSGDCFINGETNSLWIWDEMNDMWVDSNRIENYLQGIVNDNAGFTPIVKPGVRTTYLYVAPKAGTYTFDHFKNRDTAISVTAECTSVVMLYWNGDIWETAITPIDIDMSAYLESAAFEAYKSETDNTLSDHSHAISTLQKSVDTIEDDYASEQYVQDAIADIVGDVEDTSSSATLNGALNGVRANEEAIKSLNDETTALHDEIGTPDDLPTGDTDATIWGALNVLVSQMGDDRTAVEKLKQTIANTYATKEEIPDVSVMPHYRLTINPTLAETPTNTFQYSVSACEIEGEPATIYEELVKCANENVPLYIRYAGDNAWRWFLGNATIPTTGQVLIEYWLPSGSHCQLIFTSSGFRNGNCWNIRGGLLFVFEELALSM